MRHHRVKLAIVFAMFLAPLVGAFVWYYGLGAAKVAEGRANHGRLLAPAVALRAFTNFGAESAAPIGLEGLQGKWSVVHILRGDCDEGCLRVLYHSRQVRIALGRNANRVRRVFIGGNRGQLMGLAGEHSDALRWLVGEDGVEKQLWEILWMEGEEGEEGRQDGVGVDTLLVDPLGNVMMIIPSGLEPRLLLKDLKHLLRVSRIG